MTLHSPREERKKEEVQPDFMEKEMFNLVATAAVVCMRCSSMFESFETSSLMEEVVCSRVVRRASCFVERIERNLSVRTV